MGAISKVDAHAAVARCTFTTEPDDEGFVRDIVHCFVGTIGTDWDAANVHKMIDRDDLKFLGWRYSIFGRCLVVDTPDCYYVFDTVTPEEPDGS